jgi:hypothetical protein
MMITMNENNNNTAIILLVDNEPDNICVLSMGPGDPGFKVDAYKDAILAPSNSNFSCKVLRGIFYIILAISIFIMCKSHKMRCSALQNSHNCSTL